MNWLPIPQPEVRELDFVESQEAMQRYWPKFASTEPQFDLTPMEIERELFRVSERSALRAEGVR